MPGLLVSRDHLRVYSSRWAERWYVQSRYMHRGKNCFQLFLPKCSFFWWFQLPIESVKGDSMICPKCFIELERFHKFKTIATQAEQEYFKLKRMLAPVLKRCNDEARAAAVVEPMTTEFSVSMVDAQVSFNHDSINNCDGNSTGKARKRSQMVKRASEKKLHRSDKIHKCSACDMKFSSLLLLDRHQLGCHGSLFNCDKCSYQTNVNRDLMKHERTHGKSLICETCQKKFSRNSLLKLHQRQHRHGNHSTAPEETFDCDECGKSFSDPNYLKIHQKAVHDDKKAKCWVCDKICKNRKSLAQHLRSHVEIECSICNKIFTKQSINEHMRVHSPENLFKCDLCKHSTTRKGNLKTHIEKVHLPRKALERLEMPRRVLQRRTARKASTQEPKSDSSKKRKIEVTRKDFESHNTTVQFMKNIQFTSTPRPVKPKAAGLGPRLFPSRQIQNFQWSSFHVAGA